MEDPEHKMNLKSRIAQAHQSFSKFWGARDARERLILLAVATLTSVILAYAILIGPAINGRKQLGKSLPQLRQQAAQLQTMSREVTMLAGKPTLPVPAISKERIEAALDRRGMKPQSVALTDDIARVQLTGASFAGILEWLDEMQKTTNVTVGEAIITAQAQAGIVDATLTLRQQRTE